MTPEAIQEAVRLLRLLDRSEHLLAMVRQRPMEGISDAFMPGNTRFDRIHLSALAAEVESTGVVLDDLDEIVRAHLDLCIDTQATTLRAQLEDLGVKLTTRPVPSAVESESNEALS